MAEIAPLEIAEPTWWRPALEAASRKALLDMSGEISEIWKRAQARILTAGTTEEAEDYRRVAREQINQAVGRTASGAVDYVVKKMDLYVPWYRQKKYAIPVLALIGGTFAVSILLLRG